MCKLLLYIVAEFAVAHRRLLMGRRSMSFVEKMLDFVNKLVGRHYITSPLKCPNLTYYQLGIHGFAKRVILSDDHVIHLSWSRL